MLDHPDRIQIKNVIDMKIYCQPNLTKFESAAIDENVL